MWKYILRRLLLMIPVLLGVTFIVFMLLHAVPGDPAVNVLGPQATEEMRKEWRDERGLNDPVLVQFVRYVKQVVIDHNFGKSYSGNRDIGTEIKNRFPISFRLAIYALIINVIFGTLIGIVSAIKRYTAIDNIAMFLALLLVSMPGFWLGLELSIIFALKLRILPASGLYGFKYYILPVVSMALGGLASTARMTRSCMLDVINADYIVTAKAKGASTQKIIFHHELRNALIPVITGIGGAAAAMMGGSTITEIVFSIPGMGSYLMTAINARDYPVVLAIVLVLSATTSLILLVTDLAYAFFDPRIRAEFAGKGKKGK